MGSNPTPAIRHRGRRSIVRVLGALNLERVEDQLRTWRAVERRVRQILLGRVTGTTASSGRRRVQQPVRQMVTPFAASARELLRTRLSPPRSR